VRGKPDPQVELGLDCYDPEHRVFPSLPDKIKNGEGLSKRDILLILKWKTTRINGVHSQTIANVKMDQINEATAKTKKYKFDASQSLKRIPGIGLAVATAILAVCYPDDFTIIDTRVLGQLKLWPKRVAGKRRKKENPEYTTADWTAADYLDEYLPKVKEFRERKGCTSRNADRALWGLSVNKRIEDIIVKSSGSGDG
jgi:hypothetical protein